MSAEGNGATLAAELGEAIEHERLRLYYQPVVSLWDRVAGEVEALPRWPRNGNGEILAPPDFIDVAQDTTCCPRWSAGRSRPPSTSSPAGGARPTSTSR